jgi:hypothetical protein
MCFMTKAVEQIAMEEIPVQGTPNKPKPYHEWTLDEQIREELFGLRGYNPSKSIGPYVSRPINYPEPIIEGSITDYME